MKSRSAKNKGRRLAAAFADELRRILGVEQDDVRVTPSGVQGSDVQLSPKAKRLFPFCVESKNVEKIAIWAAIEQAEEHAKKEGGFPMVVFARNRTAPYVCIPLSVLERFYRVPEASQDQQG
jgi:hypothetical protein